MINNKKKTARKSVSDCRTAWGGDWANVRLRPNTLSHPIKKKPLSNFSHYLSPPHARKEKT